MVPTEVAHVVIVQLGMRRARGSTAPQVAGQGLPPRSAGVVVGLMVGVVTLAISATVAVVAEVVPGAAAGTAEAGAAETTLRMIRVARKTGSKP